MKNINAKELAEKLSKEESVCLIDVRSPGEYRSVCVDGSKNVPLDKLGDHIDHLSKETTVYVMCHSGNRSKQACQILEDKGISHWINVDGGMQSWMDASLPVQSTGKKVMPIMQQVLLSAGSLVLIGVLGSQFIDPKFLWLAGFVGAGLTFAGLSGKCYMTKALALLPWNK